jgi:hypothetical protein
MTVPGSEAGYSGPGAPRVSGYYPNSSHYRKTVVTTGTLTPPYPTNGWEFGDQTYTPAKLSSSRVLGTSQIHFSLRSSRTPYILRAAPEQKRRKHDVHHRRRAAQEVIASQRLPRARLGHKHREWLHVLSLRRNYADITKHPLVRHLLECSAPGVTKICVDALLRGETAIWRRMVVDSRAFQR